MHEKAGFYRPVLAHGVIELLGQGVVVAAPRARFGLLDAQFFQQFRHVMIDVLGTVVGVKADNDERELIDDQRQHRQQKGLADSLHTSLDRPLTRHRRR